MATVARAKEEDEVRKASNQFYAALNRMLNGDAGPMLEVWSHSPDVTAMHPLPGRLVGWEEVRALWEQLAPQATNGQVSIRDQLIRVGGDLAYELNAEYGEVTLGGQRVPIEHRVTNIYRREAGSWKMVHHHTDLSPEMQDAASRVQAPPGQAGT
jgi:ketosteroid isomerase-like protein